MSHAFWADTLKTHSALRWTGGELISIPAPNAPRWSDLIGIDRQKELAARNIAAFTDGSPALNMLLWGQRGCGKSSLVKYLLSAYAPDGFRIIEFPHRQIDSIYTLYSILRMHSSYRFAILFDDISFDEDDSFYRSFKSIMEGGLEETPENVLFLATSNRRHLIADKVATTDSIYDRDEENERSSLFARFGLCIGFYPMTKQDYLAIAAHYLAQYAPVTDESWMLEAESFAMDRGGRSGRIAKQFALYRAVTGRPFAPR